MPQTHSICLLISLVTAGSASAQSVGQRFIIDPPSIQLSANQVAARDQPLLVQVARSEKHVKLTGALQLDLKRTWTTGRIDLPVGTILHSASLDGEIFCTPLRSSKGACFEDVDHDGRFDVVYNAAMGGVSWNYIAFHANGSVTPGLFSVPQRLPSSVPYDGATDAITRPLNVYLRTGWAQRAPDQRVKAELEVLFGSMRATSRGFTIDPKSGGVGSILGAVIEVSGFDSDGAVRYRVVEPIRLSHEQFSVSPF